MTAVLLSSVFSSLSSHTPGASAPVFIHARENSEINIYSTSFMQYYKAEDKEGGKRDYKEEIQIKTEGIDRTRLSRSRKPRFKVT